jgi:hypothetical protein
MGMEKFKIYILYYVVARLSYMDLFTWLNYYISKFSYVIQQWLEVLHDQEKKAEVLCYSARTPIIDLLNYWLHELHLLCEVES